MTGLIAPVIGVAVALATWVVLSVAHSRGVRRRWQESHPGVDWDAWRRWRGR